MRLALELSLARERCHGLERQSREQRALLVAQAECIETLEARGETHRAAAEALQSRCDALQAHSDALQARLDASGGDRVAQVHPEPEKREPRDGACARCADLERESAELSSRLTHATVRSDAHRAAAEAARERARVLKAELDTAQESLAAAEDRLKRSSAVVGRERAAAAAAKRLGVIFFFFFFFFCQYS
jgi:chromosome segregation ATPase